jgi:hypothetical protein
MNDKRQHPKRGNDGIVEEPTHGNMGPTGSGGVASQSPSPGHRPDERSRSGRQPDGDEEE